MFFLITDQPAALLPTIVSRCRVVRFHPLTEEACQKRLIALGQSPEMAKKKARIAEGCVGRALEIDDGQLDLRMELTHSVFSVHHPADALGVVNMYKEDKERQKLVLDTLEIALRDILVQQAGGRVRRGRGLCAGGAGLCVPRAAFRGIDADGNAAQGARHARQQRRVYIGV